jgi:hypothetical protein
MKTILKISTFQTRSWKLKIKRSTPVARPVVARTSQLAVWAAALAACALLGGNAKADSTPLTMLDTNLVATVYLTNVSARSTRMNQDG